MLRYAFLALLFALPAIAKELPERSIGKPDAPVVIDEYASLTCTHCADFTNKTWPEVKKQLVDTGKARFVFHHFPMDRPALEAAQLSYCVPEAQFYPFIELLYQNFQQWALAKDPQQVVKNYAVLAGLTTQEADSCLKDKALADAIAAQRLEATQHRDVKATPTFIFNKGAATLQGEQSVEKFTDLVNQLSKK